MHSENHCISYCKLPRKAASQRRDNQPHTLLNKGTGTLLYHRVLQHTPPLHSAHRESRAFAKQASPSRGLLLITGNIILHLEWSYYRISHPNHDYSKIKKMFWIFLFWMDEDYLIIASYRPFLFLGNKNLSNLAELEDISWVFILIYLNHF